MTPYSRLLETCLLPWYYSSKGRAYGKTRAFLEDSQWWSRDRLREFQWQEARKLLVHAYETVPYYRRKYDSAGISPADIRSPEDFSKLPSLTRDEVNAHGPELRSSAYHGRTIQHATGGSTGVPTRFRFSIESYDWRLAASARAYSWSGCRVGERTLYLWGAAIGKVTRWKAWKLGAYRSLRRDLVFSTFQQTPELWAKIFDRASRFRPRYVVGYVSSLEEFGRYLLERGERLDSVEAVIAAAEPVFQPTRELVRAAYGAPLFNTYGSREFMSIAGECAEHRGLHVHSENILLETDRRDASGLGEFRVTDLHNYAMPFLRYEIGDMGTVSDRPCPCGRGLPLAGNIEGRLLDALRTRDGRVIPGEWFPHLMKDIPEVREFQVEQKALDDIRVSVVLSGSLSDGSRSVIGSEVAKVFGDSTSVRIEPVDSIPKRASGKRRVTVGLPR